MLRAGRRSKGPCELRHNPAAFGRKKNPAVVKSARMSSAAQPTTAPATTTPAPDPTHKMQRFAIVPRSYEDQAVSMPVGSEIVESLFFEGRVYLWAKCPIDVDVEDRKFRIIDDGDGFDDKSVKFVAFAVRPTGKALHVVEVL